MSHFNINSMRADICKAYDGAKWKKRVEHMSDSQIIAVWHRFNSDGKFDKKSKDLHKTKRVDMTTGNEKCRYVQLAFDI